VHQTRMGAMIYRGLKNTDLVLPSPLAIYTVYAIFFFLLSIPLPVSYLSMSAIDNFKSSYVSTKESTHVQTSWICLK